MNNEILNKLKSVVKALEKDRQPILLFALFLREHALERWDVIVSASWLSSNERSSYATVVSELHKVLNPSERLEVARVVILDHTDPVVPFLQEACPFTNGGVKESPKDFSVEPLTDKFGFTIKKGYILRCRKE